MSRAVRRPPGSPTTVYRLLSTASAYRHRHDDMDKTFLPHRAENAGRCGRLGLEGNLRRGHGVERFLQILDVERDLAALARDLPLDLGLIVSDLGRVRREGHAPGSPLGTGLQGELGNIRAARRKDR